jgi:hypothetical protein
MDPYLERRWSDVHSKLVAFIGEALQPILPAALRARTEERVLLETAEEETLSSYRSDVAVVQTGRPEQYSGSGAAAVATVEPDIIDYYRGPQIDRFVQIIDTTSGNRVVTAIEVLSRWNKGPGRLNKDYLRKLDDYERGEVSIVEIDLLRDPPRGRLPIGQVDLRPERRTPYLICVRYGWDPNRWLAYPVSLRQPLPRIPIPLRQQDAEVPLEFQPLIERAYVAGGHDDIDYAKPADPPLEGDDAAWADQLLRAAGRRQ